jgi:hypothetical protein
MYSGIDRGASMEHPMKRSSLVMCDGVRRAVSGSAAGIGRRAPADRGSRNPPLGGSVIQPSLPGREPLLAPCLDRLAGETADTESPSITGAAR